MILDKNTEADNQDTPMEEGIRVPTPAEETPSEPENELDIDAAIASFEEEEEYNKKADEGEWSTQDITNIAAGSGAGVARAVTGTISLAADLVDIGAKTAGLEGFEKKTLASIHETLDISDHIADFMGADEDAAAFKNARAISEGVTIGLSLITGVGAISAGSKISRAILKGQGVAKGLTTIAGKGTKAIAAGGKAKATAKGAALLAGEEFISEENANEGGFIIDMFKKDAIEAEAKVDEIHDPIMNILTRTDKELALAVDEYVASNPRNEKDSWNRLTNRLEGVVDGVVAGGAFSLSAKVISKYFKAYKQTKYNASAAKDAEVDNAFVANKVKKDILENKEVTEATKKQYMEEAKKARKGDNQLKVDEYYDEKIFGEKGILESVRNKVKETSEFFGSEDVARVFNRASSGAKMNDADIKLFRDTALKNDDLVRMSGKQKQFWMDATDQEIADVMKNGDFLKNTQEKFGVDRILITEARVKVTDEMAIVKKEILGYLQRKEDIPAKLLMSQQSLISADAALELKGSAMNSISGQFLNLAKGDKNISVGALNRFVESQRKRFKSDMNFAEFEAKIFGDDAFRKQELQKAGIDDKNIKSRLMQIDDLGFDFYRQHLLTSIKGGVRNLVEGVALSGMRMTRDVIADHKNIRAIRSAFNKDNTIIAFQGFKRAMMGEDGFDAGSKLGTSILAEHADIGGKFQAKLLAATSMGRRSVVGVDKFISTYNQAYYMNKMIMGGAEDLMKQSDSLGVIAKKLNADEALSAAELKTFNNLRVSGVDPVDFVKNFKEKGAEFAMGEAVSAISKNPGLAIASKKYADKIAMNMDVDDLGMVAKAFSKPALALSKTPILRMFMPFPRPALSALDEVFEWTPLANFPRLYERISKGTDREKKEAITQLGLTVAGGKAVWDMYTEGLITGSGPNEQRANKSWSLFNKANNIKINGKDYSVSGTVLGSMVNIIGEAHDIMELHDDGTIESEEKMKLMSAGLVGIMSEIPTSFWTDSLDPLIRIVSSGVMEGETNKMGESSIALIINNMAKSVPGAGLGIQVGSQIKSGYQSERLDTATRDGFSPLDRAWNEFKKNMPMMNIPKKVNFITGEPLETGNTWKKPVLSMNAFEGTKHKDIGDYLNSLMQQTGPKDRRTTRDYLRFTEPERTIDSEVKKDTYKLSADEYETLCLLNSQPRGYPPMVDEIRRVMKTMPIEEDMTGADKDYAISIVKGIMTDYKKAAKEQFKYESEEYKAWSRDSVIKEEDRQKNGARLNF